MSEKHIYITGHSTISWKDAIVKTIKEANLTIENLSSLKILNQKAIISQDEIVEYLVDLDISFVINPISKEINFDDTDLN